MLFFEYHWGSVTDRSVAPLLIAEGLDVIEDGKLGVVGLASKKWTLI